MEMTKKKQSKKKKSVQPEIASKSKGSKKR
jgi:hypothetical protein